MDWVNPLYLDISYQEQIQGEFEDSSEIQLKDFLKVTSCWLAVSLTRVLVDWTCLSSGGEVQGSEWSSATCSHWMDNERSAE